QRQRERQFVFPCKVTDFLAASVLFDFEIISGKSGYETAIPIRDGELNVNEIDGDLQGILGGLRDVGRGKRKHDAKKQENERYAPRAPRQSAHSAHVIMPICVPWIRRTSRPYVENQC